ncbi:MAG: IS1182 family transposase [Chloroflexi bacterium]|nr:IS1182 family transposase [Chloroflexota bacterium]
MLKPKPLQSSFYGSYLYDRIVPQYHLLRKINQVVDFSFIHELVKDRYTPDFGRPAEDPEFMLRLCLLQYLYGDSDREVVANAKMHLAYKYFLGLAVDEEPPDDTTIFYFRAKRLGEEKFRQVFENIVRQCIDKGLVKGKRQIIDSTHIEADVTRNSLAGIIRMCRRNVIHDVAKQNRAVADKLGQAEPVITKQDRFKRMDEGLEEEVVEARKLLNGVIEEIGKGKLTATPELARGLELMEKAVADRADGATDRLVSPVDADARAGKKTGRSWAGYKGHVLVEEDTEIITAVETTPANKNDGGQLPGLLKQQEKAHDMVPEQLSGDKAYGSGANLEILEGSHITGFVSLADKYNPRGRELFTKDDFKYDTEHDTMTCPAGCVAQHSRRELVHTATQKRNTLVFQFPRQVCAVCQLKSRCFPGLAKTYGRCVRINHYDPLYQQMKSRMESNEGKEAYRNRYKIMEPVRLISLKIFLLV